jgi:hypothetical protein
MTQKEPKKEVELPFNSVDFSASWNEWLTFRKEKKLPKYVPTGLKKTFSMLLRISGNNEQTAIAIINQSIELNYQGLFPLKNTNGITKGNTSIGKTIVFDRN